MDQAIALAFSSVRLQSVLRLDELRLPKSKATLQVQNLTAMEFAKNCRGVSFRG